MQNVLVKKKIITKLVSLVMVTMPLAAVGLVAGGLVLSNVAIAQPTTTTTPLTQTGTEADGLTNVQDVACNAANIIRGPAGIAIGFLVVVGGIVALQVASRDALPLIGRGVFGTALLLGATAAFAAVVQTPCAGV